MISDYNIATWKDGPSRYAARKRSSKFKVALYGRAKPANKLDKSRCGGRSEPGVVERSSIPTCNSHTPARLSSSFRLECGVSVHQSSASAVAGPA